MDTIVVKHSDNKYISSPFNIRFGGLKILKTKEKIVEIFVNDVKSELTMRLNANGDGYFLIEKDKLEENADRKKRLSEIIINQNSIANNVEKENKKTEDFDLANHNNKENMISDVLKNIIPEDSQNSKISDKKHVLNISNNKNHINDDQISNYEIINVEGEFLSAESENEDLDEDIKIDSIKINNRVSFLEDKINTFSIDKNDILGESKNFKHDIESKNENIRNNSSNSNDNSGLNNQINDILISDCLSLLLKNPEKASELFTMNIIPYKNFINDPWSIINNQNIVFKINDEIFPIKVGLPILLSKLIYKAELPNDSIKKLYLNKSYFGIKSNNLEPDMKKIKINNIINEKSNNNESDIHYDNTINNLNDIYYNVYSKKNVTRGDTLSNKIKSTTPSTDQIKLLNLKNGKNDIKFICRSRLSGEHVLSSEVYLWDKDDKIIISDVDGTITKSDVLGQLMPMFGNDWAQPGVSELYKSIERNGYKIIYLTARAICQSSITKNYLNNLSQNNIPLPKGPLVMSPDGLFTSFKREVIDKTPQILKIAILTGIKSIFPNNYEPFHAGFGNRNTDAVSYRAVGIKMSNIFIIDEKGEIKQLNNSYKKSYSLLNEIVDQLFPKNTILQE